METRRTFSSRRRFRLDMVAFALLAAGSGQAPAATRYFDVTAGTGNGVGGSGALTAQTSALFSTTATGDATLVAAAATDDGIFQGTAGTISITQSGSGASAFSTYTLNSATFNVTNYVITPTNTSATIFAAPITLAAGINLNLLLATNTSDRQLGIGSVSGGTGSTLTIQGAQTNTSNLSRINLTVANANVSVPVNITNTGASFSGFDAAATGTSITNTITNNSTSTTLLGAASGFDLTLSSAAVVSGSAGVLFAVGNSGGAGLVTINSANTYTGATTLNNSTTGVIRVGVDNALPTGTALRFGISSNNTGALDLNGHSQTIGSLAVTGTGTVNGVVNTSTMAASLRIGGSATTTYSANIGVPVNITNLTGANNNISLSLLSTNTGSLTLTGANSYTGATAVGGGTLVLSTGSINGSTSVQVTGTGALTLGNAAALSDAGTLSLANGTTFNLNGAASTSETVASLILNGTAEPAGTYMASDLTALDPNISFGSTAGETLTVTPVPEPATVFGGLLLVGALGWSQRRRLR